MLNARGYTMGHEPDSYEFSTLARPSRPPPPAPSSSSRPPHARPSPSPLAWHGVAGRLRNSARARARPPQSAPSPLTPHPSPLHLNPTPIQGGWISTAASGMKRTKYGNIEDIIIDTRMVTVDGIHSKKIAAARRARTHCLPLPLAWLDRHTVLLVSKTRAETKANCTAPHPFSPPFQNQNRK